MVLGEDAQMGYVTSLQDCDLKKIFPMVRQSYDINTPLSEKRERVL